MSDIADRLRASVKFDAVHGSNHERSVCGNQMIEAAGEIERLKDEAVHNEGVMVALKEGYQQALDRIAELEGTVEYIELDGGGDPSACVVHIITDEQIDAAVEVAEHYRLSEIYQHRNAAEKIWEALNKLGIKRCEGCDHGYVNEGDPDTENVGDRCPDCNGHGWVRK